MTDELTCMHGVGGPEDTDPDKCVMCKYVVCTRCLSVLKDHLFTEGTFKCLYDATTFQPFPQETRFYSADSDEIFED